jgi:hypothetical protein
VKQLREYKVLIASGYLCVLALRSCWSPRVEEDWRWNLTFFDRCVVTLYDMRVRYVRYVRYAISK